jgi:hypothetical protein
MEVKIAFTLKKKLKFLGFHEWTIVRYQWPPQSREKDPAAQLGDK